MSGEDALMSRLTPGADALLAGMNSRRHNTPEFFIGDEVRVVLEGTLAGYNRQDGHYYLVGSAGGHVPWLYTLHWSTPFEVTQIGPRNLGDGAATKDEAWAAR